MRKWVVRLVIIFGLLFMVGLVAVFLSLNTLVKSGVERVGPIITQTEVRLASVNISPFSGTGHLHGLSVGNPPGYQTSSAISVGDVKVAVNVKSVMSSVVVVDSISVDGPEVTFEGGLSGNNLSKLLANINSVAGTDDSKQQSDTKPVEGGKKFKIKDLVIRDTRVNGTLTGILGGKVVALSLREIHLTDLGSDEHGISSAELSNKIMHEIFAETLKALAGSDNLIGKQTGLGKAVSTPVQKAAKGFKSLFKR